MGRHLAAIYLSCTSPFNEPQLDLAAGFAVRQDAVSVFLDQGGEFLKRPQPFPRELLSPAAEQAGPPDPGRLWDPNPERISSGRVRSLPARRPR